jgi:hypothetical protein
MSPLHEEDIQTPEGVTALLVNSSHEENVTQGTGQRQTIFEKTAIMM